MEGHEFTCAANKVVFRYAFSEAQVITLEVTTLCRH